jgi:hypothetical protein
MHDRRYEPVCENDVAVAERSVGEYSFATASLMEAEGSATALSMEHGDEASVSHSEETPYPTPSLDRGSFAVLLRILMAQAGFALWAGLISTPVERTFEQAAPAREAPQASNPPAEIVLERILFNESNGDPAAKNKRSSAVGAGQFLDETWLELIRAYRPDLMAKRTERQVLDLRKNPRLSRKMTGRLIERNAAALAKRGLPITAGSLYLAHFAGPAGAAAILTSPRDADAATVIANADARPEVTRTKIVNGNPFLRGLTAEGLRNWADTKMKGLAAR